MTRSPKPRPVYIAAMQREISGVVGDIRGGWRGNEELAARHIHLYWNDEAVVACAGMGGARACLAVEAALTLGPAAELVSVGWAGACDHRFEVGTIVRPEIVIDARTGERFFLAEPATTEASEVLVTVSTPASAVEKQRLNISYCASAVDMEAAAVARLARADGLPFSAIKAISDDADFELPDMQRFSTEDGQFREAAFGLHAAMHPSLWNPVRILAKSSKLAALRLHKEIEAHIQTYRDRPI